jgi:carbon monoxide dehydrogenase subunit G
MKFDGVHEFTQPPAEVWDRLTDARFLVPCLPDLDTVKEVDADRAVCVVKPGFSFARGTLEMAVQITDKVPGQSAKMVMNSKGIGSTSTVEATFNLEAKDGGGCVMKWNAAVTQLGGLLRAAPSGLLQASAKKVLDQAWANVQAKMNERPNDNSIEKPS